ncbi:MAG: uroporphyrinogen decarboxylase [Gammaproteobacteria bacterium RIFCSPHIGHO2_12_FULL_41_20]|nr:MAG: uroporphyrinogen decarboxylase [Gammaproteobacteria bacterium RIFCSPHIGHO2_12_FULL_41_20]
MTSLHNDRLLRAIAREPVDMTPVWLMRQAGRYLPEYREVRKQAGSFLNLCKTPELACEVTLQPIKRYPLDAAILFSDILTIPDAMGLGLQFEEGIGPTFAHPIRKKKDINQLTIPNPTQDLAYVLDAIKLVKKMLANQLPLIGFCGSPWTIAAYMVEGRANPGFPLIRKMTKTDPALLHVLLEKLAQAISLHLQAQIQAGVHVVMIFDTWGGMLDNQDYQQFSLHYVQQIVADIKNNEAVHKTPVILFTRAGNQWLELMAQVGCDVLGVDWGISLAEARRRVGSTVALQGNIDPAFLYQSPEEIKQAVAGTLAAYGHGSGHIFNLGHGIPQDVSPEHVGILINAVHELSRPYHTN